MRKSNFIKYPLIGLASAVMSAHVLAVGPGLKFNVEEGLIIPADEHTVVSNSMDFTYHACLDLNDSYFSEFGYLYISSYQDVDSVVDSQINYIGDEGYRMYAKYNYEAQLVGTQPTPSGTRANYLVNSNNASFTLYLDPEQDTRIGIGNNCVISAVNTEDDLVLGFSNTVMAGEKSETDGLAQGDFKVLYDNWQFTHFPDNPIIENPDYEYDILVFNGNVTRLREPLNGNHRPEGSGNIFWR